MAEKARDRDVTVTPLFRYCLQPLDLNGLVLGFSGIKPAEIRAGVEALADVLTGLLDSGR